MSIPAWQEALSGAGELYRVGGCVRDRILGLTTSDTDFLVRGIAPDGFERVLAPLGKLTFVGRAFGVYKFTPDGEASAVDIAFPRTEHSIGSGHRDFAVQFDPNLSVAADLARRDFTANAIAERVTDGKRVDPFGGERDIHERTLRMIFPEAFAEDPLRILRGARFSARFDMTIESHTARQMAAAAAALVTVSPERIQGELSGVLTQCEYPSRAFTVLHDIGGLTVLLPELERAFGVTQNVYHPDDVYWHTLKSCDAAPRENLAVRWAALLHDLGKVDARQTVVDSTGTRVVFYGHEKTSAMHARAILSRLRYANAFVDRCCHLVAEHMFNYLPNWSDATVRRFIRRIGITHLDDLFALRAADCRSRDLTEELRALTELEARVSVELRARCALGVGDLAIDGADIMNALARPAGPEIGQILQALLEMVTDAPELNTSAELLERARMLGGEKKNRKPT